MYVIIIFKYVYDFYAVNIFIMEQIITTVHLYHLILSVVQK